MLQRTALILNRAREITNEEKEKGIRHETSSRKTYTNIEPLQEIDFNSATDTSEEEGIRQETSSLQTYTNLEPLQEVDFNSATDISEKESTHTAAVSPKTYSDLQTVREVEFNLKLPDIIYEEGSNSDGYSNKENEIGDVRVMDDNQKKAHEISLQKKRGRPSSELYQNFKESLVLLWPDGKPIPDKKLEDLKFLLSLIPKDAKEFYKKLTGDPNMEDDIDGLNGPLDFDLEDDEL
ncbi:uncharacterized protein LOC126882675 [Diabrotica virgifera virgifera]|uniref:Uncharacterized protein n=1 Tax=Diabrotica virgifera virgifera TaxID=50390 RepID=A0ABM5K093_DIAVI|nr:uncharacterized protein LOC126882675 [Diabrotica virgifera virgifera]